MAKPRTANGYTVEMHSKVRMLCAYIATKFGDLFDAEELVVVGGLVPTFLIAEDDLPAGCPSHVGTTDLDLGLAIKVLDDEHYELMAERLRSAGLEYDVNERGNPTLQRWRMKEAPSVTIDFLMPRIQGLPKSERLHRLKDLAAIVIDGLHLAFQDKVPVLLHDEPTLFGELTTRRIWVCGPGAYLVLKALAFFNRGQEKDAYDLYYVLKYHPEGLDKIASRCQELIADPSTVKALKILKNDFCGLEKIGPLRVARFLDDESEELLREVAELVIALLEKLKCEF